MEFNLSSLNISYFRILSFYIKQSPSLVERRDLKDLQVYFFYQKFLNQRNVFLLIGYNNAST